MDKVKMNQIYIDQHVGVYQYWMGSALEGLLKVAPCGGFVPDPVRAAVTRIAETAYRDGFKRAVAEMEGKIFELKLNEPEVGKGGS